MKRVIGIILILVLSFLIISCNIYDKDTEKMFDFYAVYQFEIPFEFTMSSSHPGEIMFHSEYSFDDIVQKIAQAGYDVEIYVIDGTKKSLISVIENDNTYYYVLIDKNTDNDNRYILSVAQLSLRILRFERGKNMFRVLAPIHILDIPNDRLFEDSVWESDIIEIYESFDYLVDFYSATGMNDVMIDELSKAIIFECRGNYFWAQGEVIIQYIETQTGNFINIRPVEE